MSQFWEGKSGADESCIIPPPPPTPPPPPQISFLLQLHPCSGFLLCSVCTLAYFLLPLAVALIKPVLVAGPGDSWLPLYAPSQDLISTSLRLEQSS